MTNPVIKKLLSMLMRKSNHPALKNESDVLNELRFMEAVSGRINYGRMRDLYNMSIEMRHLLYNQKIHHGNLPDLMEHVRHAIWCELNDLQEKLKAEEQITAIERTINTELFHSKFWLKLADILDIEIVLPEIKNSSTDDS